MCKRLIPDPDRYLQWEDLTLDYDLMAISRGDKSVKLSPIMFEVFDLVMRNAGQVITHITFEDHIWPNPTKGKIDNRLTQAISTMRRIIKHDLGRESDPIVTVAHRGYGLGINMESAKNASRPS